MPNYDLFNSPIMQAAWQDPVNAEFLRGTVQAGGAPQLQEAVADEQAQAKFNQDKANLAFMAEMANRGAYAPNQQSPALVQGLMPGLGETTTQPQEQTVQEQPLTLTQMARQKALDVINAKNLYAQGEAMGGEQGAKVMQLAHAGAERARSDLQQLGVDPAQYGLNGTYEEAAQGLANNDMRTLQNVLDGNMGKTSIAHYDDMYNYLIEQGASREIAAEVAGQRARTYAIQRIKTLEDAFNTYGHDGKVINPMGVQILQKLAEEEPDMAKYYVERYAGPLQEYADAKQQRNMATQQANKERTMAIGHSYDLENKSVDQQNRIQLKGIDAELNRAARAEDFQYRVMLLNMKAAAEAAKGGTGGNGVPTAQLKVWQEEVKRADEWDEKHIGQEKDNPYRASANAYKAMIDRSQGVGEGNNGGKDYDLDDYGQAMEWVQDIINQNAAKPPKDQLDKQGLIANLRKGLGYGAMADNILSNIEWGDESDNVYIQNPTTPPKKSSPRYGVWSGNAYS